MPSGSPPPLPTQATQGQIQVVVQHQQVFPFQFEELYPRGHAVPAEIHQGLGLKQKNLFSPGRLSLPVMTLKFCPGDLGAKLLRQTVDDKKPDVMPGLFVFLADVAETDDEFGHLRVNIPDPINRPPRFLLLLFLFFLLFLVFFIFFRSRFFRRFLFGEHLGLYDFSLGADGFLFFNGGRDHGSNG